MKSCVREGYSMVLHSTSILWSQAVKDLFAVQAAQVHNRLI